MARHLRIFKTISSYRPLLCGLDKAQLVKYDFVHSHKANEWPKYLVLLSWSESQSVGRSREVMSQAFNTNNWEPEDQKYHHQGQFLFNRDHAHKKQSDLERNKRKR